MELKEMVDTAVIVNNDSERLEYLQLCEDAGWVWQGGGELPTQWCSNYVYPYHIAAKTPLNHSHGPYKKNITLAEFKERQGIMKYSVGDVLESNIRELEIQGVVGKVYITIDDDKESTTFSEEELADCGYTLKTDDHITEVTLDEVAEKMGIPVDKLRIKD